MLACGNDLMIYCQQPKSASISMRKGCTVWGDNRVDGLLGIDWVLRNRWTWKHGVSGLPGRSYCWGLFFSPTAVYLLYPNSSQTASIFSLLLIPWYGLF
jgi:hypothetical protein